MFLKNSTSAALALNDKNTGGVTYNTQTHTHTHVSYARNELLNTSLGIFLIRNAFHTRWPENIHVGCLCESFSQRLFLQFLFDFSIDSSSDDEHPIIDLPFCFCKIFVSHSASLKIVLTCARLEFLRSGSMDLCFQTKIQGPEEFSTTLEASELMSLEIHRS